MRSAVLLALLLFIVSFSVSAQVPHDTVAIPAALAPVIPAGYMAIDIKYGNLNLDTATDALVVVQKRSTPSDSFSDGERAVLILIKGKNGYTLAARNDEVVFCQQCGGMMDPYDGIEIGTGQFSVSNYGGSAWRWGNAITFVYNKADKHWYATQQDNVEFHVLDEEHTRKESTKTVKELGKVRFEKFSYPE